MFNTITYSSINPPEWQKLKIVIIPNADEDAEKPDDSYIANRNLKDLVTVEKLGLFSKKLNMQLP